MRDIPECLRGVITTRRYANPRLPYLYFYHFEGPKTFLAIFLLYLWGLTQGGMPRNAVPGPSNMAKNIPGPIKALLLARTHVAWTMCVRHFDMTVQYLASMVSDCIAMILGHKLGPKANLGDHRKKTEAH